MRVAASQCNASWQHHVNHGPRNKATRRQVSLASACAHADAQRSTQRSTVRAAQWRQGAARRLLQSAAAAGACLHSAVPDQHEPASSPAADQGADAAVQCRHHWQHERRGFVLAAEHCKDQCYAAYQMTGTSHFNTGGPRQALARRWRRSFCVPGTRLWCAPGQVRTRCQAALALAYLASHLQIHSLVSCCTRRRTISLELYIIAAPSRNQWHPSGGR